ncbi:hypothetical protein M9Y10_001396 [Tritrichomonas musculus]|uniref:Fungal lipase-type domain-containing protein n=1 Tax=Tritrichomonas musculus TaxID=1915356 RepID=A0ABR2L6W1_9EUKA
MEENNDNYLKYEIDDSEFSAENDYIQRFSNYLIPLLKLLILIPGKIMRFILLIGDFYYFLQIFSIAIEFIVIQLVLAFANDSSWNTIIVFLFSCMMGNVLTVPAWELLQFRWIQSKNPLQTFCNIFSLNKKIIEHNPKIYNYIDKISNFILGILFYAYIFTLIDYMNSTGIKLDKMNSIVLLFIPAIKFGSMYICYLIKLNYDFYNKNKSKYIETENPSEREDPEANRNGSDEENNQNNENNEEASNNSGGEENNDNRHPAEIQNNANFSDDLDPFIIAVIPSRQIFKSGKTLAFFILKAVILAVEIIYVIKRFHKNKIGAGGWIFGFIVVLYVGFFALPLSMPIWILNIFHRWDFLNIIGATEGINKAIRKKPIFNGFKYICLLCQILPPLLVIGLFALYYQDKDKKDSYFYNIKDQVRWNGQPSGTYPLIPSTSTVKSAMCFSKIYGLNMIQIGSIAAASYYDDIDDYIKYLQNSFFRDENYDIRFKFLLNKDNGPVLLQADLDNMNSGDKIRIYSIRGSRAPKDWWLDVEIFVSSAMLSVAKWIPFLQRQEDTASNLISNFMTLPLNLLHKGSLTYQYTNLMINEINKDIIVAESENRKILFTGHSLGGGLSKVLASKYQHQSVALSGPGITPIENIFVNKSNVYDKFFKSKFIDIVPDRDIVPRFEMSGGTRFRVLCNKNVGECHDKFRTICQMGLLCNDEYHTGDFCSNYFHKEYDNMKKLAHIT